MASVSHGGTSLGTLGFGVARHLSHFWPLGRLPRLSRKSVAFAVNDGDGLVPLSSIWLRFDCLEGADRAFLDGA